MSVEKYVEGCIRPPALRNGEQTNSHVLKKPTGNLRKLCDVVDMRTGSSMRSNFRPLYVVFRWAHSWRKTHRHIRQQQRQFPATRENCRF